MRTPAVKIVEVDKIGYRIIKEFFPALWPNWSDLGYYDRFTLPFEEVEAMKALIHEAGGKCFIL